MLNIWQQQGYKELSAKKIISSFNDKENYGINCRLLKLYIKFKLQRTKINTVLEYTTVELAYPHSA